MWKKYIIIALDIIIGIYLCLAVTSFNNPRPTATKCTKVNIKITDESNYGFLNVEEIKSILEKKGIYPISRNMADISPRHIESVLRHSPFVNTAQCCKTKNGHVLITITQRSPIVRIKSITGDDFYLDENGGVMPNSKYTSDLIIVTGHVNRTFARRYLATVAGVIMADDLWRNQIEQINVCHDLGIELVPRVGNHIVFLGYLPMSQKQSQRNEEVKAYMEHQLDRLYKFYKYGLNEVGWNKYYRIDLQYDNQIICKKHETEKPQMEIPVIYEAETPITEATTSTSGTQTTTTTH